MDKLRELIAELRRRQAREHARGVRARQIEEWEQANVHADVCAGIDIAIAVAERMLGEQKERVAA